MVRVILVVATAQATKFKYSNIVVATIKMVVHIVLNGSAGFEMSEEAAKQSTLISEMIEEDYNEGDIIPVANVKAEVMAHIVLWCENNLKDRVPAIKPPSPPKFETLPAYHINFVQSLSIEEVFRVMLAANFLGIDPLVDLMAYALALKMKDKTPTEIRTAFGIPEPTPEEEEKIRRDNQWVFDYKPPTASTT